MRWFQKFKVRNFSAAQWAMLLRKDPRKVRLLEDGDMKVSIVASYGSIIPKDTRDTIVRGLSVERAIECLRLNISSYTHLAVREDISSILLEFLVHNDHADTTGISAILKLVNWKDLIRLAYRSKWYIEYIDSGILDSRVFEIVKMINPCSITYSGLPRTHEYKAVGDALITFLHHMFNIPGCGDFARNIYMSGYSPSIINIGCFSGYVPEALSRVEDKYGKSSGGIAYSEAISTCESVMHHLDTTYANRLYEELDYAGLLKVG